MSLLERIESRQFSIAVFGLGYVGLPLAVEFAKAGIKAIGIDVDTNKVEQLRAGGNYIQDLDDAVVRDMVESGKLVAETEPSAVADADVIYVCVPTPFYAKQRPGYLLYHRCGPIHCRASATGPVCDFEGAQPSRILQKSMCCPSLKRAV